MNESCWSVFYKLTTKRDLAIYQRVDGNSLRRQTEKEDSQNASPTQRPLENEDKYKTSPSEDHHIWDIFFCVVAHILNSGLNRAVFPLQPRAIPGVGNPFVYLWFPSQGKTGGKQTGSTSVFAYLYFC